MVDIRLVLVEGDDIIRAGIQMLIEAEEKPINIMTYNTVGKLQQDLEKLRGKIKLVLVGDSTLSPTQLFDQLDGLHKQIPDGRIVLISERLMWPFIQQVLSTGVMGYVHRSDAKAYLIKILRFVLESDVKSLSPKAIDAISIPREKNRPQSLNKDELIVLRLLANDLTLQQIQGRLKISYQTVCRRRRNLKDFLGVSNNDSLVDAARRQGLI
ncbi:MAG: DNA-binding response regulator [Anaerolineaceae bacterium]|nr:MAG: DNA-binding response regulator [Anaerolineaceae bacterium]